MKRQLTQRERIVVIHWHLCWGWPPVTISLLAEKLSVANVVIERDVWAMRHVLGLPVAFDGRARVAYAPPPDLDSDVFDLADKLLDYVAA